MKILFTLIVIALTQSLLAQDYYTWTDTKDRSIQAEFISLNHDKNGDSQTYLSVSIKKSTGAQFDIQWETLSQASQEQAIELQQALDFSQSPYIQDLASNMVKLDGKSIKRYKPETAPNPKYIAIYYSASWCGPCKSFTPKLVDFYNQYKNDQFEIVFMSRDNSEGSMEKYIKADEMPWPTLKYSKSQKEKHWLKFMGKGIPCLVVINSSNGEVISHSYDGNNYIGPTKVMSDLQQLISKKS